MDKLLINPLTQAQIDKYLTAPAQVVALTGADGSGQGYVASYLAARLLDMDIERISDTSDVIYIDLAEDKKEITIDQIRQLIARLKVKAANRRVIIINSADKANREAQNALLKSLEQAPQNTYFILAMSRPMLPTVMSRAQTIIIKPISLAQAKKSYDLDDSRVTTAWSLSEGAAGLLHELLTSDSQASGSAVLEAKKFISGSKYDRLLLIDGLSKDRQKCLAFLEALEKVIKALHHAQIKKQNRHKTHDFIDSRRLVEQSIAAVSTNGSPKLTLLNLVVNLSV